MAEIGLGIGSSEMPQLSSPPERGAGYAERDRRSDFRVGRDWDARSLEAVVSSTPRGGGRIVAIDGDVVRQFGISAERDASVSSAMVLASEVRPGVLRESHCARRAQRFSAGSSVATVEGHDFRRYGSRPMCDSVARMACVLAGVGAGDVARVGVLLEDPALRDDVNAALGRLFPESDSRPARHTTVRDLPGKTVVQLEVMALGDIG